jgi:hypothetical protein
MNAIKRLCSRCFLFDQGQIVIDGDPEAAIEKYLLLNSSRAGLSLENEKSQIKILKIMVNDKELPSPKSLAPTSAFNLSVFYEQADDFLKENYLFIEVYDIYGNLLFCTYDIDSDSNYYKSRKGGRYKVTFNFPPNLFNKAAYRFRVGCGIPPKYNSSPDREKYFQVVDNIWLNFIGFSSLADNFFKGTRGGGMLLKIPSIIERYDD